MKRNQSLAGVLRERLEAIERRLEVGIRQEVIVAELAAEGHGMSVTTFRTLLSRARKWREESLRKKARTVGAIPREVVPERIRTAEDRLTRPVGFDASTLINTKEEDLF